jgi:murein DD-endopeptidase MepM/ murein hydrolase activator NlpD
MKACFLSKLFFFCCCLLIIEPLSLAAELLVYWPTPNKAFFENKPLVNFVQSTQSGKPESGTFGLVRNSGTRFHGGIDLKAIYHSRSGEPQDTVFAALEGCVAHINTIPGNSAYGRYVVIEHKKCDLPIYSLYAHLATVEHKLQIGDWIQAGTAIGTMGRSSSVTKIPKERAHLHFEIGLRLATHGFPAWYKKQSFNTPNAQGIWNGLNLVRLDPLTFFKAAQKGNFSSIATYVHNLPTAFTVLVHSSKVIDFLQRYPMLINESTVRPNLQGWQIEYTWFGFPKKWSPVYDSTLFPKTSSISIISIQEQFAQLALKRHFLAKTKQNRLVPGKNLINQLAILFGAL